MSVIALFLFLMARTYRRRKTAGELLPRVRDWMTDNSWVISEAVIVFFLALTISGLFS